MPAWTNGKNRSHCRGATTWIPICVATWFSPNSHATSNINTVVDPRNGLIPTTIAIARLHASRFGLTPRFSSLSSGLRIRHRRKLRVRWVTDFTLIETALLSDWSLWQCAKSCIPPHLPGICVLGSMGSCRKSSDGCFRSSTCPGVAGQLHPHRPSPNHVMQHPIAQADKGPQQHYLEISDEDAKC